MALVLLLSGCSLSAPTPKGPEDHISSSQPAPEEPPSSIEDTPEESDLTPPNDDAFASQWEGGSTIHPYLKGLVAETTSQLYALGMSEYERTKAAFDYMITHTVFDEPIGLSLWRIHGGGKEPIPYVQQRALSPLRFGVGTCEDYASALTLLLQDMGLEAQYVPGLTYSKEGNLVDHAWTMVQIDGTWYHLDSQLEDGISRQGSVRYRYFLKGDATMAASHRWGQNLIDTGLLTAAQNEEIAEDFPHPTCPQDYPTPERFSIPSGGEPDLAALRREADGEIAAWEREHGPLSPMELDLIPPVFGRDGFGPPDEG